MKKIFERPLSDYVLFAKGFIFLIALLGITRLALSLAGIPNSTVKWFSMTAAIWVAVVYYSVRVHVSGFGSYKQLLPPIALLNLTAQAIAIAGIAIAIFSGHNNIFSSPEFAFGGDGKTFVHLGAHVLVGTTVGTLLPWMFACLFLAVARKYVKTELKISTSSSAAIS